MNVGECKSEDRVLKRGLTSLETRMTRKDFVVLTTSHMCSLSPPWKPKSVNETEGVS